MLSESEDAFPFHLPEWLDVACAVGGCVNASRLYEMSDGRMLVVPLAQRRSGLPMGRGWAASLPPNWGFGGIIGPGVVRADEIAAVVADLASLPVGYVALRPGPLAQAAWAAAVPAANAHIRHEVQDVDLSGGFDALWKSRFAGTLRTAVRKAERAGLEIRRDTSGHLLDTFYELYRSWLDRRADERRLPRAIVRWSGERREPLRRYRAVAAALGDACRTWVAFLHGQPVASIIILSAGGNTIYWRGASDKELANRTRANDLLMKRAIEEACVEGCRWFHMGESGGVESLMRWKERFGARSVIYEEFGVAGSRANRRGRSLSAFFHRSSRWGE